jgi:predicted enzyme related to lactoylglutathione lyase
MFNIFPDGKAEIAVEANWSRETSLGVIGQIALVASDVQKLLPFYRDVLGLAFLFAPSPQLAFLAAGDVRIMLTVPQGAGKVGENSVLYFKVRDVERVQRSIVDRGAAEEQPPHLVAKMPDHELWIGFVRDPDGNLIGLMEEKR